MTLVDTKLHRIICIEEIEKTLCRDEDGNEREGLLGTLIHFNSLVLCHIAQTNDIPFSLGRAPDDVHAEYRSACKVIERHSDDEEEQELMFALLLESTTDQIVKIARARAA